MIEDSTIIGSFITGGTSTANSGELVSGNTMKIKNVVFTDGNIYGGFGGTNDLTRDNRVEVEGYANDFNSGAATIYGGNSEKNGNTLFTKDAAGMAVASLKNFEHFEFELSLDDLAPGTVIYDIQGDAVELDGTDHKLTLHVGNAVIEEDETILVLINKTDGKADENDFDLTFDDGIFDEYNWFYGVDEEGTTGNAIIVRAGGGGKRKSTRQTSFGQAQLAGLQMANIAADFARSIVGLYRTARDLRADRYDPCSAPRTGGSVLFAGIHGGTSRWNTDGDTKTNLDHVSMLTGLGWQYDGLLLAAFFGSGHGKYDAKLGGRKVVDGEKTNYIGGGFLARYERDGFYGEADFHAGRVKTDFASKVLGTDWDTSATYDTKSGYVGIDALIGYKLQSNCSTFDFSARYSWNRIGSDNVDFRDSKGSTWFIDQDSVNSQRIRAGMELSYNFNDAVHPYVGAYYEHEFQAKSKVRHRFNGERLTEASMRGSSGIGEIGVRIGGGERRLSADIGVEGYVGKRQGIAGKAMVGYAF